MYLFKIMTFSFFLLWTGPFIEAAISPGSPQKMSSALPEALSIESLNERIEEIREEIKNIDESISERDKVNKALEKIQ